MKTFKCPSCDANLTFSDDREFGFCEYCGTKILLEDYRVTQRIIDEAKIKEAEVHEKELEFKHKMYNSEVKINDKLKKHKTLILLLFFSLVTLGIMSVVILSICSDDSEHFLPTIFLMLLFSFIMLSFGYIADYFKKIDDRELNRLAAASGGIRVPISVNDIRSFDYLSLQSVLKKTGFKNIETSNLHDIYLFGKTNKVEAVTINGEPLNSNKIYMPNDLIVIKYHGR